MMEAPYASSAHHDIVTGSERSMVSEIGLRVFYGVKPIIPRAVQLHLRHLRAMYLRRKHQDDWPIDHRAAGESGVEAVWPHQKRFALVLTHDLEDCKYAERCWPVIAWEKERGLKSAFNLVPARCKGAERLPAAIKGAGFEVGVHGLVHDGKLYQTERVFRDRAVQINEYLRDWGVVGFRSPAMHHNLDWLRHLEIKYDSSTFDSDPFQPQPDGVRSVLPFFVEGLPGKQGYVELPCTLPQDFTLFIELRERNIDMWKMKLDWIAKVGGLALINTHPDYMWFGHDRRRIEEYPAQYYKELLDYVAQEYEGAYWNALPREVATYWKSLNRIVSAG